MNLNPSMPHTLVKISSVYLFAAERDDGGGDIPVVFLKESDAVNLGVARLRELYSGASAELVDSVVAEFERELMIEFSHKDGQYILSVQTCELRGERDTP